MTPEELAMIAKLQSALDSLPALLRALNDLPSQETLEKVLDRMAWSGSLLASTADRHVVMVDRLEKSALAFDRNTDASLLLRQRVTEIYEQREFIRAGLEALKGGIDGLHAAINVEKAVAKATKRAVRDSVREITNSHRLLSEEELGEGGEGGGGRVGLVLRAWNRFTRAKLSTQILTFLLALLGTSAFLGYLFYKLQVGAEAPQGKAIEQAPGHQQVAPMTPQPKLPAPSGPQ